MRVGIVAAAAAALAAAGAGAAPPGANVGLVFAQNLGTIEFGGSNQNAYICAAPPNGSTGRKVTPLQGRVVDPDVSPSGDEVAYTTAGGPNGYLERVPAGGGPAVRPAGNVDAAWPAWSSDGARILFSGTGTTFGGDLDIFAVPREGGTPTRIVGGPMREAMPAPSPDDSKLAFVRSDPNLPSDTPGELWVAGPEGEDPVRVLPERSDIRHPSWSYDGQTLVFQAGFAIYSVDWTSGTVRGPLAGGSEPELSPDGTRIAFVRDNDVWTMSAGGGDEVNVTHSPIDESGPTWQAIPVPTGGEEPCAIAGTPGNDVLTGTDFADFFYDGGGDDVIRALGGDDRVSDDDGDDRFELGDGNDRIFLDEGRNHVVAGAGADEVVTGYSSVNVSDPQTLEGGDGDDSLQGGTAADRISGGDGRDAIFGQRGPDTIFAGPGDDLVQGNRGDDVIDGGLGNDRLYGGRISGLPANHDGYDVLLGRGGNDRIAGGWQKDRILGGTGADRLRGGPHADHIRGEEGRDDVAGEGGDDLLLARDRVRDVVFGGPGFDRATMDAVDRRGGIERALR